jgi:AbrB family looped-hinge helix DNA binding protein
LICPEVSCNPNIEELAFHNAKCHYIMAYMTTTLTLDKAGRVVLPKPVRDEMQLRAGDSLELESSEDRIVLRPRRGGVGLHQKQGIWVFGVGEPIPAGATDETLRQIRRERELSFMGNLPTRRSRRRKSR